MPAGHAPQFKGVEPTVKAYRNNDIPAFAVCYAKDINFRYMGDDINEGAELLQAWLSNLKDHGTQAIYQLRLYEDLGDKKIKNNTPYDMAIQFVLNAKDGSLFPATRSEGGSIANGDVIRLLQEMAELKAENAVMSMKLDNQEEDEDEADKPKPAEVKSMGLAMLERFTPLLTLIGDRLVDAVFPASQPAKVAGATVSSEGNIIEQSIGRLRNSVPDNPGLGALLSKLADIAERQPGTFSFYMNMLMQMKVD